MSVREETTTEETTPSETSSKASPQGGSSSTLPLTVLLVLGCVGVATYAALGSTQTTAPPTAQESAAMPVDSVRQDANALAGEVKEVIQVSSYTYLRVQPKAGEEFWAAVPKTNVPKGSAVAFDGAELMSNFSSKELDRTFDRIYFARLANQAGLNPHAGGKFAAPTKAEGEAAKRVAAMVAEEVPIPDTKKAEGPLGRTVAEIHDQSSALSGSKVRVRGTVVKLTRKVMGTNFLHIRDGSVGTGKDSHDLVLKLAVDPPERGAQGVFEGTVTENVDLGAGYSYAVLLEDARVIDE